MGLQPDRFSYAALARTGRTTFADVLRDDFNRHEATAGFINELSFEERINIPIVKMFMTALGIDRSNTPPPRVNSPKRKLL